MRFSVEKVDAQKEQDSIKRKPTKHTVKGI
jgi:hypothetical protein